MKWYTCCNEAGLASGGECLIAAVESCLTRTRLKPHLIFDGPPNALMRHFERRGVTVVFRSLSFAPQIARNRGAAPIDYDWLLGNALRFDIPLVEAEDEVVLYTDTDVLFHREVALAPPPAPLAAIREILTDDEVRETDRAFNAGVMLMNVKFMRSLHPVFERLLIDLSAGTYTNPWYDQGIMNSVCAGLWAALPQTFNCRPYFGCEGAPIITHFQFLKPNMMTGAGDLIRPDPRQEALLRRARPAYLAARRAVAALVSPEARSALLDACPAAVLSR
ncbi:hypothetical protein [Methylobacterium sp. ID0610]|uniref:hypothetical protein n=1 Tax=Methylobacterium carpenticola TaxID=3344827 RepID=UPI0036C23809